MKKCLDPQFSLEQIAILNTKNISLARDVYGVSYLPGLIGLNNLNCTDSTNALLHLLSHVTPFRDFFLVKENYALSKSSLVKQFGLVIRKMWSGANFKSIISPQELVQEISIESKKRFRIGARNDCLELMVWLLRYLHTGIYNNNNNSNSAIYEPFQVFIE